jgi:hypothetical protein
MLSSPDDRVRKYYPMRVAGVDACQLTRRSAAWIPLRRRHVRQQDCDLFRGQGRQGHRHGTGKQ